MNADRSRAVLLLVVLAVAIAGCTADPHATTSSASATESTNKLAPAPAAVGPVSSRATLPLTFPSMPRVSSENAPLGSISQTLNHFVVRLFPHSEITAARMIPAPRRPTVPVGRQWEKGNWIILESRAVDPVDRLRARWQAWMVISAVWHVRHLAGYDDVDGGELWPMRPNVNGSGEGTHWYNSLQLAPIAFTVDGVHPSPLVIEPPTYRNKLDRAAAEVGLRIVNVNSWTLQGSAIEIDAVADHPKQFVCENSMTTGSLAADSIQMDGMMVVVRDPSGDVVKSFAVSTGLQGGEGGLGAKYEQYDRHTPEQEAKAERLCGEVRPTS